MELVLTHSLPISPIVEGQRLCKERASKAEIACHATFLSCQVLVIAGILVAMFNRLKNRTSTTSYGIKWHVIKIASLPTTTTKSKRAAG